MAKGRQIRIAPTQTFVQRLPTASARDLIARQWHTNGGQIEIGRDVTSLHGRRLSGQL